MKIIRVCVIAILLSVGINLPGTANAQQALSLGLAENHIDITTGFAGAPMTVFGVTRKKGNVAILVQGPERTTIVRRKAKVLGTWINRRSVEFHRVPVYYNYALSAPENVLNRSGTLTSNGIGLDALNFYPEDDVSTTELQSFREALIRNKQGEGLFPLNPEKINFIDNGFFRASFHLPANVPTGTYTIKAFLLRDGELIAGDTQTLHVGQVGFAADIYNFARYYSLSYGSMAVLLAMLAGWSAFAFLRRD